MQRFYTFFVAVMLAVAGFAQKTVTFVIEHPEHIGAVSTWAQSLTIGDDGKCVIPNGDNFTIVSNNIAKITDLIIDNESKFTSSSPVKTITVYDRDIEDGSVIEVKTQENPTTIIRVKANPEHVYLTKDYFKFEDVENVDGEWTIEDKEIATYGVTVNDGYQITNVETNIDSDLGSWSGKKWEMPWTYTTEAEHVYTVTTAALADLRTEKLTVNITGDASKVLLYRAGSYDAEPVVEGENVIMFQESESPFSIEATYGKTLYSVKFDGQPVAATGYYGNTYSIPAVNGSVVDIDADYPDIDVPVKFTFVNEGCEGIVAFFRLNDETNVPAEEYLADGYTVKYGDKIYTSFNSGDYTISSITLNGNAFNSYGDSFFATDLEGYEFVIDATPKPAFQMTVNCEAWEHVKYTIGWAGEYYSLTSESCVLSIPASTSSVNFFGFDDYSVTGIESDADVTDSWDPRRVSLWSVDAGAEFEITVLTAYTDRAYTSTFYLQPLTEEDIENNKQWWTKTIRLNYKDTNMYKDIELTEGYNTVKFADTDNPISLQVATYASYVFINGEKQEPDNMWSTAPTEIEIEDGDIVKIMYYDEIANYNVVYAIDENADVKIYHDQVIEVAEPDTHSLMEGTEVRIVFNEIPETETHYFKHQLKINDEEVEFEDGEHVFNVADHTNIEVKVLEFTGVENIATDANVPSDVYNLQGVRILNNATAEQIKALPAGIYVVGGQKRVIR